MMSGTKRKRPKAVLLDMDGVLVDSMPYHFLAWYEALRAFGVRVSCQDVYAKEGEHWDASARYFLKKAHRIPTKALLAAIFESRQKIFKKYFRRFIFQGAPEFIRSCKRRGFRLALVTGTPMREVRRILPPSLLGMFDAVVTGDLVRRGKPHPEPYLTAARLLKVRPDECCVIENAPYGIRSALSARMYCIAVTTSLPKKALRSAHLIVDDLAEIRL